ncbi:hypothetical protein K432DRAFT_269200, partial [Lepidopterella palustris CBS 459.81]
TYLVSTFKLYAASVLAATVFLRSVFGCVFSIIGFQLCTKLGYGWGTTMSGFLASVFAPVPAL